MTVFIHGTYSFTTWQDRTKQLYYYFQILIQLKTHNKPIISFIKTGEI